MLIEGSVAGPKNGYVTVRRRHKKDGGVKAALELERAMARSRRQAAGIRLRAAGQNVKLRRPLRLQATGNRREGRPTCAAARACSTSGAYPGYLDGVRGRAHPTRGEGIGLDLTNFRGVLPPRADVSGRPRRVRDRNSGRLGGAASSLGVVGMSDMAPSTTGRRSDRITARSFGLFMRAFDVASAVLAPGGEFVAKIFQGGDFPEAKKAVQARFEKVRIVAPATRDEGYEVFVCGQGFRGEPEPAPET